MKYRVRLFITAVLGFLLGASTSVAQESGQETPAQASPPSQLPQGEVQETRTRISRREASDLARGAFEGRVLNVTLEGLHWRIRMDHEGNVFNVMVDANSGRVARASN